MSSRQQRSPGTGARSACPSGDGNLGPDQGSRLVARFIRRKCQRLAQPVVADGAASSLFSAALSVTGRQRLLAAALATETSASFLFRSNPTAPHVRRRASCGPLHTQISAPRGHAQQPRLSSRGHAHPRVANFRDRVAYPGNNLAPVGTSIQNPTEGRVIVQYLAAQNPASGLIPARPERLIATASGMAELCRFGTAQDLRADVSSDDAGRVQEAFSGVSRPALRLDRQAARRQTIPNGRQVHCRRCLSVHGAAAGRRASPSISANGRTSPLIWTASPRVQRCRKR
jgi:hypothetical protein